MVDAWHRNLGRPDEVREYPRSRTEIVRQGELRVERSTFQPGWRWADHVSPCVAAPICEVPHTGYLVSGRLGILMGSGEELELSAGDVFRIAAGHDTWTVGDEPCVPVEFIFTTKEK
jgi:quercetin dioxygenase-like cupin family protein